MNDFEIFEAALEFDTQEKQFAYVEKTCRNDPDQKGRIISLILAHREVGDFLHFASGEKHDATTEANSFDSLVHYRPAWERIKQLLTPSPNPHSPGMLGHYSLLQVCGEGGFGIVIKAFDEKLQRTVALKILSPFVGVNSTPRRRFFLEAQAVAAIHHENVVQVYSVEEEPIPFIVMEYVHGPTLYQMIKREGPIDLTRMLAISRQIAAGLAVAHAKKLVHRDIKPGNILLEEGSNLRVKITDFGLAQVVDDANATKHGVGYGTPLYMSPEQATHGDLDVRSDLFSLGSVMYHMATGRAPFRGEDNAEILRQVVSGKARPIRQTEPEIPDWFCQIINSLHAKAPQDRLQSARELCDLITSCENQPHKAAWITNFARLARRLRGLYGAVTGRHAGRTRAIQLTSVAGFLLALWLTWPWLQARFTQPQQQAASQPFQRPTENTPKLDTPTLNTRTLVIETEAMKDSGKKQSKARPDLAQLPNWQLSPDAPRPLLIPSSFQQARQIQQEWSLYLNQPVISRLEEGPEMILVPPGEFDKTFTRRRDGVIDELMPTIRFRITKPFRIAKTEITNAQFEQFVRETGFVTEAEQLGFGCTGMAEVMKGVSWTNPGWPQPAANEPVAVISASDASAYCRWLSDKHHRRFRLPTEAEWIHAARAGSESRFVYGEDGRSLELAASCTENSDGRPTPVGRLAANGIGLHDMLGNVWERTVDWLEHEAILPYLRRLDPVGTPISNTIGGCFAESREWVHTDAIVGNWSTPTASIGFRIVEELEGSTLPEWSSHALKPSFGQPTCLGSLVTAPVKLPGLASWGLYLRNGHHTRSTPVWHPADKRWIVGGKFGSIDVLDQDENVIEKLVGPASMVELQLSADGKWLAAKDSDESLTKHIFLWNWPERTLKAILPFSGSVFTFSPDSTKLIFSKHNRGPWNFWGVYEIDLDSGSVQSMMIPHEVVSLSFGRQPDRFYANTLRDQGIHLEQFSYPDLRRLASVELDSPVSEITESPNGELVAVYQPKKQLVQIFSRNLDHVSSTPAGSTVVRHSIQWYDDSNRLFVSDKTPKVVEARSGSKLFDLDVDFPLDFPLKLFDQASMICGFAGKSLRMHQFDMNSGQPINDPIIDSTFKPSTTTPIIGNRTATFHLENQLVTHDLQTGMRIKLSTVDLPLPWGIGRDGERIVSMRDGQVRMLNISTSQLDTFEAIPNLTNHKAILIKLSNDSQRILFTTVDDQQNYNTGIFDLLSSKVVSLIRQPTKPISLVWSHDDKWIAGVTGGDDRNLILWDSRTGQSLGVFASPVLAIQGNSDACMTFVDESRSILISSMHSIASFDTRLQSYKSLPPFRLAFPCRSLHASPDGRRVALSRNKSRHQIYDAAQLFGQHELDMPASSAIWTLDSTVLLASREDLVTSGISLSKSLALPSARTGSVVPWINQGDWLVVSPEGHYCGSEGIQSQLVIVAIDERGRQQSWDPEQFSIKFGHMNDPGRAYWTSTDRK